MKTQFSLSSALVLLTGLVGCSSANHRLAEPEGNWGPPVHGLRLSVHFDKDSYAVGEEIAATVLFWNVNNIEVFAPTQIPRHDTEIIATDERGKRLEPRRPPGWDKMSDFEKRVVGAVKQSRFKTLPRGAKEKYQVRLTDVFDFATPGTYQIVVRCHAASNGKRIIDARSGNARITITATSQEPKL